ncbi:hypothetical protein AYJ57_21190 (plasmid) [Salipiger sp. CCB-MM3]|uniref:hypothetical protein n=1 Tax=Salipiger sp. CCB-MM3 TaxID=1792508 RepID=UPI00080AA8EF|nr:hypothetical protein [Salipiger sp. CCB-MM3]ANT62994.1 hypothetical protein AYJ57_21190 [Salipiger sp. CCB-MM3]
MSRAKELEAQIESARGLRRANTIVTCASIAVAIVMGIVAVTVEAAGDKLIYGAFAVFMLSLSASGLIRKHQITRRLRHLENAAVQSVSEGSASSCRKTSNMTFGGVVVEGGMVSSI